MTGQIRQLLREKFAPPAYALFEEVKNQTGYAKRTERYADALALSLWPSRGIGMTGFEIKVSRADWQRELADPEKAAEFMKYCVAWYVVAPEGIVERLELPATWGLIEVPEHGRKRLATRVEAPKLTPQPWDMGFVAALLRRQHEQLTSYVQEATAAQLASARSKLGEEHAAALTKASAGEAHYKGLYEGLLKRLDVRAYEEELLDLAVERLGAQIGELRQEQQIGWKIRSVSRALEEFVNASKQMLAQLEPAAQAAKLAEEQRRQLQQQRQRSEFSLAAPGR